MVKLIKGRDVKTIRDGSGKVIERLVQSGWTVEGKDATEPKRPGRKPKGQEDE